MGMSEEQWTSLNEDEKMPLYNRFRQIWCPGSSLKPVVAGIGLKTGAIDPDEDFGSEGTVLAEGFFLGLLLCYHSSRLLSGESDKRADLFR